MVTMKELIVVVQDEEMSAEKDYSCFVQNCKLCSKKSDSNNLIEDYTREIV